MNLLTNLTQTVTKSLRRVGRGYGSKKGGHTSGRGAKGDKVRGKSKITFDGTKIKKSWLKRTPFLRGKHRLESRSKVITVDFNLISSRFQTNDLIDTAALQKVFMLTANTPVKVLSRGKLDKIFTFKGVSMSQKASDKVIAAGGKIEA